MSWGSTWIETVPSGRSVQHRDLGTSLENLADLEQAMGNFGAARLNYEKALAIFEESLGRSHTHVASTTLSHSKRQISPPSI